MDKWIGKVAVVTGASSGIGRETARQLIEKGMIVVGFARREDRLKELEKEMQGKPGKLYYLKVDLCSEKNILDAFKWVKNTLKTIDVLVNNAGVWKTSDLLGNSNDWKQMFDTNVIALSICSKEAVNIMRETKVQLGQIINVNGVAGHYQVPFTKNISIYTATKFSVTSITESLRELMCLENLPIRVTSISPGAVDTEMLEQNKLSQVPGLQMLKCIDVVDAIVFVLGVPQHVNLGIGPFIKYYSEEKTLALILEQCQYLMSALMNILILTTFILKRKTLLSNYYVIQSQFVRLSEKKGLDPNTAYRKNIETMKIIIAPTFFISFSIIVGPFLAAINDMQEKPLDERSHWPLFWPNVIKIENFGDYAFIYSLQAVSSLILIGSIIGFNFGIFIVLSEIGEQFEHLLIGIKNAFCFRKKYEFKNYFIECIQHHTLIIKHLNKFKSYFKWIYLIEIILQQVLISTTLYCIVKVNAPLGYKLKGVGVAALNIATMYCHCVLGDNILLMHTRLANMIYQMKWYDMPVDHKQLLVVVFQRTRKDLMLNAAVFSSETASRSFISKILQQVYTILTVLLKT